MKNAGDYNAKCLFPKQVEVVRVIGMPINSISNTSEWLNTVFCIMNAEEELPSFVHIKFDSVWIVRYEI